MLLVRNVPISRWVKDNPDFEAFLLEHGFTRDHEEKAGKVIVYTKKDFPALLSVVFGTDDASIRTVYLAIQDKAYPTSLSSRCIVKMPSSQSSFRQAWSLAG